MNSRTRRDIAIALMLGNPLLLKKAINRPRIAVKKKVSLGGAAEEATHNLNKKQVEKAWFVPPAKHFTYPTALPTLDHQLNGGFQPGLVLILSDNNASLAAFFSQCVRTNHPYIECKVDLSSFSYLRIYPDFYDVKQFDKSASWEESYLARQRKQSIETDSVTIVPRALPLSMIGLPVNPSTLEQHLKAWAEWEKVADTIMAFKSLPQGPQNPQGTYKELIIIKNRYGNSLKPLTVDFKVI